jgi:hypothetical protein
MYISIYVLIATSCVGIVMVRVMRVRLQQQHLLQVLYISSHSIFLSMQAIAKLIAKKPATTSTSVGSRSRTAPKAVR